MGGATTEIGAGTTTVLLEAAHWDPTGVARTARRHRLPSEAAKRFERGVDPEMTVVALARAAELLAEYGGGARRRRRGRPRHPRPRPPIALDAGRARPAVAGVPYTAGAVVELLDGGRLRRSTPTGSAAGRHPAVLAPGPDRPGRPGRGGRPARRVRRRPVGAADRAARPRAHRRQRRRRSVGRTLAEAGYVEVLSYPFVGTAALDALGPARRRPAPRGRRRPQPAVGGGAGAADHAAARPARDAGAATSPAASATWRCSSTARCSPAASARRRRCPASTGRPDDATLAALLRRGAGRSRGTWPSRWPATASRAAGGARAGRPAGPTRSRPPGVVAAAAGRRADRAGRGAGALAPGPVRGAAGRRPGRRARRRAAPAGLRGAGAARRARRRWSWTSTRCRPPRCRRRRRSPPSRRCCSTWRSWSPTTVPAADGRRRRSRDGAGELLESVRLFDVYTGPPVAAGPRSLAYALTLRAPGPDADRRGGGRRPRRRGRRRRAQRRPGRAAWLSSAGQVALVTGASTGIGRHLAEGLAARGMAVAGLARGEERLTDGDGRGRRRHRRAARWRWPPTSPTGPPSTPPWPGASRSSARSTC